MGESADPNLGSPALLRRLARDNQTMGPRLAQLEFQQMMRELANPTLFDLVIDFPEQEKVRPLVLPTMAEHPMANRAPVLNVTLGRTAWNENPDSLPVVGIFISDHQHPATRPALAALMRQHHAAPFARFVFLCASMRPIPFLGRYEFTYEYVSAQYPVVLARRLRLRYGMEQIRDLGSGRPIWRGKRAMNTSNGENSGETG